MQITFAKDLRNLHSKRAAVIPYTFIQDSPNPSDMWELWVLLGKHVSGEITDFGGGVKRGESDIDAAFREFNEETCGIFADISKVESLDNCLAVSRLREEKTLKPLNTKVLTEGISTIFLPISNSSFNDAIDKFREAKLSDDNVEIVEEITNVIRLKGKDILQPTNSTYKMWSFIRKFYYEALRQPNLRDMLYVSWLQHVDMLYR